MKRLICICTIVFAVNLSYSQGFNIVGSQLKDANGNDFIIKGFSIPLAWFIDDINNNIENIRKNTGANCLRIVVETDTPDSSWQICVKRCIENKIIPMVELHDVTCDTNENRLLEMANFWAEKASFFNQKDIARYILINIANEWGNYKIANSDQKKWLEAYMHAITAIRDAGIKTTIVIDAPNCGQDRRNGETINNFALDLQKHDTRHNLLFSVHMYCEWSTESKTSSISEGLKSLKNAEIPFIVGEFGYQHDDSKGGICDISEETIINACETHGIGWLAWSWKGNNNPVSYLDLSLDWEGNNLTKWGNTVVNSANGTKTAITATTFNK